MDKAEEKVIAKEKKRKPDLTDKAFKISLLGKGLVGLLETLGGILLLIIKPEQINTLAEKLTAGELSTDPNDFLANHILNTAHGLTGSSLLFGSIYLLSHGVVKLVLVIEVWRDHLWAYLGLIVVTILFVIYQIYHLIFVEFTISFVLLTLFDLVVIYLTQKEYGRHKQRHEHATPAKVRYK